MTSHDAQKARLLAALPSAVSPTRDAVRQLDRRRLLGAAVVVVVLFVAIGGIHVGARPPALIAASAVVWGAVATVVTALALWRGTAMLGTPRAWLAGAAAAVVPALAFTWFCLPLSGGVPSATHAYAADATCFLVTLGLAAGPLVVFFRRRSDGDPVQPAVTGAALGAAAGAWGAALIDLHCDRLDPVHVLLGHVAPVALLAIVGAVWGAAALRVRAAS